MTIAVTYLSYPDATRIVSWLAAIGFVPVVAQTDDVGRTIHAELVLDDAVVMIAQDDREYIVPGVVGQSTGVGVYLVCDDVDALFERAVAAGASVLFPPEDTEWGARRARVIDPGGREWSFGTYRPGIGANTA